MSNFPDWVLEHKEKGTTIRKINNKYYKYKVHSERKEGTKYPVLVQDELLGTITENGFVPSTRKMIVPSETEIRTLYSFQNDGIFIERYGRQQIEIMKTIYLINIGGRWYVTKLNEIQRKFMDEYKIGEEDGEFIYNI
jgi:hypothetical protein